ncbi:MAG: hypothetical protein OEU32_10855 [Acidimicrobiia bacterium]|nr:hypothetical protein [Acidimicrobiia bacterium]
MFEQLQLRQALEEIERRHHRAELARFVSAAPPRRPIRRRLARRLVRLADRLDPQPGLRGQASRAVV